MIKEGSKGRVVDYMEVGLDILENLRISIGESVGDIIESLDNNGINYTIPKVSGLSVGDSDGTMIIFIESYGVELSIMDEEVVYIKTNNSELNYVTRLLESDNRPLTTLKEIKSSLAIKFGIPEKSIRIDRFNTKTFDTSMSIPYRDEDKIRVVVVSRSDGTFHIETIQMVK